MMRSMLLFTLALGASAFASCKKDSPTTDRPKVEGPVVEPIPGSSPCPTCCRLDGVGNWEGTLQNSKDAPASDFPIGYLEALYYDEADKQLGAEMLTIGTGAEGEAVSGPSSFKAAKVHFYWKNAQGIRKGPGAVRACTPTL